MTDWIEHNGGECPVDAQTSVQVRFRDGRVCHVCKASAFRWWHVGIGGDIVAYRIAEPKTT
jgi:hypothetical protein